MENRDILIGSNDKTIKIWRNNCIKTFKGHEDTVRTSVCMKDGIYLVEGLILR